MSYVQKLDISSEGTLPVQLCEISHLKELYSAVHSGYLRQDDLVVITIGSEVDQETLRFMAGFPIELMIILVSDIDKEERNFLSDISRKLIDFTGLGNELDLDAAIDITIEELYNQGKRVLRFNLL